jgi:hypothetical protein
MFVKVDREDEGDGIARALERIEAELAEIKARLDAAS